MPYGIPAQRAATKREGKSEFRKYLGPGVSALPDPLNWAGEAQMQPNEMIIFISLFCPSLTDEGWGVGKGWEEEEVSFISGFLVEQKENELK